MDFRVRPSSKKSQQSDRSLVQLPAVRGFQSNPAELRSVYIRLDNLEGNFSNYQDLWRREREISNAGYLDIQKRMDILEYKTFSNQKDVRQLLQRDTDAQLSLKNDGQIQSIKAFSQSEIVVIKQALAQQRDSHREYAKHQSDIIEQMTRRQMRMEAEIRQLLNKQRDDYDHRLSDQLEEIRNNENLKQKKIENQYELMKTVISNTEKKIFAEFERKLRNETVIKDFIEDKLAQIRQEMASEQKTVVSKESKFIREIKQSIESIFAIIKNTQKQLTEELAQTQKLSANNLKSIGLFYSELSTTIELIKEKHSEEINALASQTSNLQSQIQEMKNFVNAKMEENREMLMEMEEQNFNNSGVSRGWKGPQESSAPSRVQEPSNEKIQGIEKEFNNWKATTEQKNLNVFKQISSTLKAMKLEWRKENDEISSEIGSFKQSLGNVKKSVPLEIKKSIQTIITVFNNQFDTLAQELDTITDMIALSKKQTEKLMKEEIKKSEQDTMKEVKELIKIANRDIMIQLEKMSTKLDQSMKFHTENEIKFVKDMMIQKYSNLEAEMSQVSQSSKKNNLNTTAQLEDFTLKLKTFNQNFKDHIEQQRKDDMKKRIQLQESMRKNANNLMDIYYKKCEFLVDGMKKAIEMNILKDITTMKRDVEALKEDQNKNVFQAKQELLTQMNQKMDKMNEERESSEEVMHEAFDNQLNAVRKNLSNEIGNSKLEMGEKINELIQSVNEMRQKGTDSTEDLQNTVQSLKEAVWKIEAMSFAEQAKNKALIDRMGQDINDLSLNLTVLSNELKPQ